MFSFIKHVNLKTQTELDRFDFTKKNRPTFAYLLFPPVRANYLSRLSKLSFRYLPPSWIFILFIYILFTTFIP